MSRFYEESPSIRGTAIIETLLVFIPVWTFFAMALMMLQYWETEHLDESVEMENQFAQQTHTGILFDVPSESVPLEDLYSNLSFYGQTFEDSSYAGTNGSLDPSLPKHYYYVTGPQGRRLMIYRGTNTWCPFIWLRGQHWGENEDDRRREWYEQRGNTVLEEAREHLLTGS